MKQHNPPHVGQLIQSAYIDPFDDVTVESLAEKIGVPVGEFRRLLDGEIDLTIDMVQMLSDALGRSPESWLKIQKNYKDAQIASLMPWQIKKYLESTGWVCGKHVWVNLISWYKFNQSGKKTFEVVQPINEGIKEYSHLLSDLLKSLSKFESRPILEIVIDMKRLATDSKDLID